MTTFSLFSPHSPADCTERLRAALGPGREPLVAPDHPPAVFPAYGDVTGATIAMARAPGTLLANRPKVTRLTARMTAHRGGTVITGRVHPPTWAVTFFLIWLLIAVTVVLHCLIPAMQEIVGDFGHRHHSGMHDLIVTVVLPIAGFGMLLAVDERWRAQAATLRAFLMATVEATEHPVPRRRSSRNTPVPLSSGH